MKNKVLFALLTLATGTLLAADSGSKDDVIGAAKKLAQTSYSWKNSTEFGNFNNTSEGKATPDGLVELDMTFRDNTTQAFIKGDKGAVKPPEQDWKSLKEMEASAGNQPGRGQFMVRRLRAFKAPAIEAQDLVAKAKELKQEENVYSGALTEAGAKELLSFGPRRGGNAPEPRNAKGSVKFWTKDGALSKYELKLQGTMEFNGEDRDIDRTTTVEIKDAGTTKIQVPEAAKEKLS